MLKLNENERLMCYALLMCGDTFTAEQFHEIRNTLSEWPRINLITHGAAIPVGGRTYKLTPAAKEYLEQDSNREGSLC